jgi:hypothetical protein
VGQINAATGVCDVSHPRRIGIFFSLFILFIFYLDLLHI